MITRYEPVKQYILYERDSMSYICQVPPVQSVENCHSLSMGSVSGIALVVPTSVTGMLYTVKVTLDDFIISY